MNIECACAIEMAMAGKLRVAMDYMIRDRGTVELNIMRGFYWRNIDGFCALTWCQTYADAGRRVHEQ